MKEVLESKLASVEHAISRTECIDDLEALKFEYSLILRFLTKVEDLRKEFNRASKFFYGEGHLTYKITDRRV